MIYDFMILAAAGILGECLPDKLLMGCEATKNGMAARVCPLTLAVLR